MIRGFMVSARLYHCVNAKPLGLLQVVQRGQPGDIRTNLQRSPFSARPNDVNDVNDNESKKRGPPSEGSRLGGGRTRSHLWRPSDEDLRRSEARIETARAESAQAS